MKRHKIHLSFLYVFIAVVMFAFAGTFVTVFQQKAKVSLSSPAPTPAPHTTYTSDNLGIRFTYLTQVSGVQHFFTKEIGNTIYLYYNFSRDSFNHPFLGTDSDFLTSIAPGAFSVEVFDKDPQQPLKDAIKQQFLIGYAENDCFVKVSRYGHPRNDESYQTFIIDFPHQRGQSRKQLDDSVAKCPKYVTAHGISYFLMDPQHPNKLLFIKIGQSNIPSGLKGLSWDETIMVL